MIFQSFHLIYQRFALLKRNLLSTKIINLLYALCQDEDRLSESLILAQQFLDRRKRTGMEEFSVRYFINLARKRRSWDKPKLTKLMSSLSETEVIPEEDGINVS